MGMVLKDVTSGELWKECRINPRAKQKEAARLFIKEGARCFWTLDSPLPPRMKKGIAYSSGRKSSTTAAINIAPEYGSKGGSIIFNPSEAGSFMDLAKTLPRAFMGGSFAGDLGVSSLAVHEFGHSLARVSWRWWHLRCFV